MGSLGRVLVGYRQGDPKIAQLWEDYGRRALPYKKCVADCGATVYFVESGQDAIRTRDPEVICNVCWADPRIKANVYADL
jgi:hypothetical protein